MPSLRCMFFDKWLHKGQISQEEYNAVMKKLDGHNKQIRADVILEMLKIINERITLLEDRESTESNEGRWIDEEKCQFAIQQLKLLSEWLQKGEEYEFLGNYDFRG